MKTDSQLQYDVAEALGWNAGFTFNMRTVASKENTV
jgi:hypothetical protein